MSLSIQNITQNYRLPKFFKLSLAIFALSVLSFGSFAQAQIQDGLAFVNVEAAISQTEHYREMALKLEQDTQYLDLTKRYQSLVDDSRRIEQTLRRDADLLSDNELKNSRDLLAGNQQELEVLGGRLQAMIGRTNEKVLSDLRPLIELATKELISTYKVKALFPTNSVIWFEPTLDLTLELAKAVDLRVKNGGIAANQQAPAPRR